MVAAWDTRGIGCVPAAAPAAVVVLAAFPYVATRARRSIDALVCSEI
jgi:hypothetical protein